MANELEGQQQALETPIAENQTPTPVALKDEDLVEVVWKGEKVVKPWKEARANIQMQEDYTRSKQAVAQQAKELKELYDGLTAKEKTIIEKEAAIDAILGRTPRNQEKVEAPDEVLTRAQVNDILSRERETMLKSVESKLTETSTRAEQQRMFERWEDLTNTAVESLQKEHPALANIPHLSLVLKRSAMEDRPNSERDLVQAIVKAGKKMSDDLEKGYNERRKEEATRRNNLVTKGPDRTAGSPQFAAPKKSYGQGRKIDWADIERDVVAALEAEE